MKLGICYMVFDGEELLEFALKSIRNEVDHVSVTYQTTSYFGNPADPELSKLLQKLKSDNLIDELIHFEPDLSVHPKVNELNLRNLGRIASKNAGCTHHISADVDELYEEFQLKFAKNAMEEDDYDFSVAPLITYYKHPTYLITPIQKLVVSFIHPIDNEYNMDILYPTFPFHMETTRRFSKYQKYRVFDKDEFVIHHMSYVRKDIRKKLLNSDNGRFYKKMEKFISDFDKYNVGDRVCIVPDFMNRKTILVENTFGIQF